MRSHMRKCANIREFLDMLHNFRIDYAISKMSLEPIGLNGKMWDMRVLTKYAIAYNQHS